jgi:phage-related protein
VTRGSTGRGLLPQFSKLRISSSQAIGTVLVNNTGDVPMFPRYQIAGPITNLVISSNGASFGFTDPILAGEVININTETGEVTDETGANAYALLNPAPKLFRIPVGESAILISGTDVTDDTRVDVFYAKRFEVVH